jgi:hypothetical protein
MLTLSSAHTLDTLQMLNVFRPGIITNARPEAIHFKYFKVGFCSPRNSLALYSLRKFYLLRVVINSLFFQFCFTVVLTHQLYSNSTGLEFHTDQIAAT